MSNKEPFSKRQGHFSIKEKEITVREDAPEGLRGFVRMAFYDLGKNPSDLRDITSRVLKIAPDRNNWSEYPNIDYEVGNHLEECEWYSIYDIIEAIIQKLKHAEKEKFIAEINEYFIANGIGWKVVDEQIEIRGDEVFETAVNKVEETLEEAKLETARNEMKEAIADLSRRPNPDITGAIQHSVASLECVAREVTGNRKATLGELIKKYPEIVPRPLDGAIEKIWGYTSEQGRHLREGEEPGFLEAELTVEVTAAITTYLAKKLIGKQPEKEDMPF